MLFEGNKHVERKTKWFLAQHPILTDFPRSTNCSQLNAGLLSVQRKLKSVR
jgi:hypothetical protein